MQNLARCLFYRCDNLKHVYQIPSSVTNMEETFYCCTSLIAAPEIPNSVTDIFETFSGCESLVTALEMPSSVNSLDWVFAGCTNLTGTVRINSSSAVVRGIFIDTILPITVEVPAGSTTYTNISVLTTEKGIPSNVTLNSFTAS